MYRPYQVVKKILLAFLCLPFLLLLLSLPAHAQEVSTTPTPSPTIDQSISPTPSPEPEQVIEIEAQVEPYITPTPTSSPLEETTEKSLATQITQTNDTSIKNNIDGAVNTGVNTAQDNISPQTTVDTGNASASVAETNTANVNSAGDQYQAGIVDHYTADPQIDLSGKTLQCIVPSSGFNNFLKSQNMTFAQFLAISQQNNASIINNINLLARTGNNSLSGINTKLNTGNASVDVSIVNIANVNTVGNCYFFAVINIYGDYDGDIILPYEYGYLFPQSATSDQGVVVDSADNSTSDSTQNSSNSLSVSNANTSDVSTTLLGGADTGSNQGNADTTQTGKASMTLDERTIADQNITGDGWLAVQVNNYGTWDGQILGESNIPPHGSSTIQDSQIQNSTTETSIINQNNATIVNNLFLQAITGQNFLMALPYLGSGSITTGDASVTAKILNLLNTNIVGNNWYYVLVNVFGHWKGNIRFARPDLGIHAWWSKSHVRPGETVTLSIDTGNTGLVWAERAKLNLHLPAGISLLSTDSNPNSLGDLLSWFWDRFEKNETKHINLVLKVADDVTASTLSVPLDVASGFKEDETGNNQTTATLEIEQPSDSSHSDSISSISQTSPTPSVSPTPKKIKSLFASVQATEKKPGDTLSTSTAIPSSGSPLGNTAFSQWWLLAGLIAVTVRRILQEE